MVPQEGLEPPTLTLEPSCSIQLSYWGTYGAGAESRTPITSLENWDNSRYTTPALTAIITEVRLKRQP
jgi:hypothetical protein